MANRITGEGPNPSGLCMCGCGQLAPIAKRSQTCRGTVRGKPCRFINNHDKRGKHSNRPGEYLIDESGCWIWQFALNEFGYGRKRVGTAICRRAHQVYWERANGPVPDGMELDHLCRNRACVNPAHLEAVSHAENCRRGAASKLSFDKADEIRSRYAEGQTQLAIAADYGVSGQTISDVILGKKWTR